MCNMRGGLTYFELELFLHLPLLCWAHAHAGDLSRQVGTVTAGGKTLY